MMGGYGWNAMGSGGWLGGTLMMVVWFVLLALAIYAIARLFDRQHRSSSIDGASPDHASTLLRERFARGEITADEYQTAAETLRGTAH